MIGRLLDLLAISVGWVALVGQAGASSSDYFLAPDGSDSNPGTQDLPWHTVQHALDSVPGSGGCTVWLENGTYDGFFEVDMLFASPVWFRAITPYQAKLVDTANHRVARIESGQVGFEGLEFSGSPVAGQVSVIFMTDSASHCTFRNNFIHDSYDNDLVRVLVNCHNVTFEGNVFYNQEGWDEHIDVNVGAHDITIQDNIFFNDFAGSGRPKLSETASFIVVKTSVGPEPITRNVTIRRNIFMRYEGHPAARMIGCGEDDRYPGYFEAEQVLIENNLFLFNGDPLGGAIGVRGCRDITLRANTVVGSPLNARFLGKLGRGDNNPVNEAISITNNILSHSTGNMQRLCESPTADTMDGTIDNNLYWNAGSTIPVNPNDWFNHVEDLHGVVNDPGLADPLGAIVPRWTGGGIQGGHANIRAAFLALVDAYAAIGVGSPAVDTADGDHMPATDIRGARRDASPDIGAYELGGRRLEMIHEPFPGPN